VRRTLCFRSAMICGGICAGARGTSCRTGADNGKTIKAAKDLIWAGGNAVWFTYRSGPGPFAPHRARNTDEEHRGTPEHQGSRHLTKHQIPKDTAAYRLGENDERDQRRTDPPHGPVERSMAHELRNEG
jgi:hypothetical protein